MRFLFYVLFFFLQSQVFSAYLSLGGGVFEVARQNSHTTSQWQIEYRSSWHWKHFHPQLGFFHVLKGSIYLYGGFAWEKVIKERWVIAPNFSLGWYQGGKGKNLGYPLEFRSAMELSWQLRSKVRIGSMFYHISNASLGYKNPGEESLVFFISIPFSDGF